MPAIVILGAQWGDEGKGKATDQLATTETIDYVVRTSGGHNAGHTIVVDVENLVVSANAHVIASYHSTIDKVAERFLGANKLGTTGRGIGPAYADKINRIGIRIADVFDEGILAAKVEAALDLKNHMLVKVYNRRAISVEEILDEIGAYAERLRPM